MNNCAKNDVLAVLTTKDGQIFWAYNSCDNPQDVCPRKDMPSGVGYELCKTVCQQTGHAEENVCKIAGKLAKGAHIVLFGHDYCCENCVKIMKEYGVFSVHIYSTDENYKL